MNKPKFNVGDKVWVIDGGKAVEVLVKEVFYRLEFDTGFVWSHDESKVFQTKEDLIKSL